MKFLFLISNIHKKNIERIINYKENIIIKPENYSTYYSIKISPVEDKINSTMIVKIYQGNTSPFYLQRNQLNLGFIRKNIDNYYYYMEIFKGEEGEIMIFNKRKNGVLISNITKKIKNGLDYIIPKVDEFPIYNESNPLSNYFSEFNIYNQKLSFTSSDTEKCEAGCFLLISYYSRISKFLEIKGTEFSILSRIWNKEELKSQLINIPLNEYIFGYLDETSVNIHYYSVFIPNETDNISIEIHGINILSYYQEGIAQINTQKITRNCKKLFDKIQNKTIIKLNKNDIGLDSFKGKYISFAFEKDIKDIHSYYYFRILQHSENDYIIYPLDTNKENYCKTKGNKCFFLLRNEYNELLNEILIYSFEKNNIAYKIFCMNNSDYYSKNLKLENLNEGKEIPNFNGLLNLDLKINEYFILIVVESDKEEDNIVSNFKNQSNSPSIDIDIYSFQLYYLSKNQSQQFKIIKNLLKDYKILFSNIEGEGYICFNQICDNNIIPITAKKLYSFSIYSNTSFVIYAKNNLTYNIKIFYEIPNQIKETSNPYIIIIIILIIVFIIAFILFLIIYSKIRIKPRNIEEQINDINLPAGINEDLIKKKESDNKSRDGSFLNVFM